MRENAKTPERHAQRMVLYEYHHVDHLRMRAREWGTQVAHSVAAAGV